MLSKIRGINNPGLKTNYMKKNSLLLIIISFMVLASISLKSYGQGRYDLKGSIKGVTSGTISLSTFGDNNKIIKTIDSGAIVNNSFELKGNIDAPQMVDVKIMPGDWRFQIIIENSQITLNADTLNAVHRDYTKMGQGKYADITNFMMTGSPNFDDWASYQNEPQIKKYDQDEIEFEKQYTADKGNDSAMNKAITQFGVVARAFREWQKNYISDYVNRYPSSMAGIYMLYDFYSWLPDERVTTLNTMLPKFTGEAASSKYFATLSDVSAKLNAVLIGGTAPDFTLLKRDSTRFNLAAFAKGKYIMIDFWASWCAPCRQMIPHWKTVYQKYHDKGLQIVSVSGDFSYKNWVKGLDAEKMPWIQVIDEFKTNRQWPPKVIGLYETPHIPYYFLLDKNGKILAATSDEIEIGNQLKKIYGE
jgi:thiol-disulfide isomerase/thioredoxin